MALYHDSIHKLAKPFYSAQQLHAWAPPGMEAKRWTTRLAGQRTIVAEVNGALAGFVTFATDGHLDFLFTHPDFARRGVASGLCEDVESALREIGVARIFTEASLAARAFFEQRGFIVDAEERVNCRGAILRRFAMHKTIRPIHRHRD